MPQTETTRAKKLKGKKTSTAPKISGTKKGKSSTYNAYMTSKLAELKKANPTQAHKDALKAVTASWKADTSKTPAK